ncbi:hypothetical protein AQI88_36720 [Streptomyces cellostaticus]|uniref:Uncharacterized protein n=1 Tax=Streptomyces cellostaticus TaxID=67285 RepID=A0A124HBJ9_9ACTN|nr:hypothetical protein [Streptomyces cellostaticus]KUM91518.1 hypothetical protein AQI88_36720 [Streptomyces cellostaticus]GHI04775.1 hypothetical protein Scel_30960 [Streptomyces cellostaticus]
MFELELHRTRTAELRREADQERLAREAVRSRRTARREEAARHSTSGAETHTDRPRRQRLPRTA